MSCRAELQRMKKIQPRFATEVAFVAVDIGYNQNLMAIRAFAEEQGYPWDVGHTDTQVLKLLDVQVQSTKIAVDADGVIIYRAGYGEGDDTDWLVVFERLVTGMSI